MLSNLPPKFQTDVQSEAQSMLPSMTAAFINCLQSEESRQQQAGLKNPKSDAQCQSIAVVPLNSDPVVPTGSDPDPIEQLNKCRPRCLDQAEERLDSRALIKSISHPFNNLLMGIWGNITLLRMRNDLDSTADMHLSKMDKLVEGGAFLMHMVLGYLSERRIATQRLRLDQIMQELLDAESQSPVSLDRFFLKKQLKWAADVQQPSMIAGSTAKVLDNLLKSLGAHHQSIRDCYSEDLGLNRKLDHIKTLIVRGQEFVAHLSQYAEAFERGETVQILSELKRSL